MRTWLTEQLDVQIPVVSAPMAGVSSGRLAGAVSAAGGLGMIGVGASATDSWIAEQAEIAGSQGFSYGVGLTAWILEQHPEQLEATLAAQPALVSVSFGDYARYAHRVQEAGIPVATQVGTLDEAVRAEQAGVDVIVARGAEGGGHGRNEVATLPLLQAVLDSVSTPVLAAGGIATARGLAAVLAAGAVGGWLGTAFAACPEADSSPAARQRMLQAKETDTAYGRVFDIAQQLGWPSEYGGRALRNAFFDRWIGREDQLLHVEAARVQLSDAKKQQEFDVAYIYAGQGVGELRAVRSAAEVLAAFADAERLLRSAIETGP